MLKFKFSNKKTMPFFLFPAGKRGLYTVSSGLKIAYVSGVEQSENSNSECHFNADDCRAVKNSCLNSKTAMGDYRGIDILLTSQWPSGISEKDKNSSKLLSWLALEVKPRYHFCGLNDIHFEREPYRLILFTLFHLKLVENLLFFFLFRNSACQSTQLELSSRFISLASVGNIEKQKYIYALNIAPVEKLRLIELIQRTTNETPCPYDNMELMSDRQTKENVKNAKNYLFLFNIFFFYLNRKAQLSISTIWTTLEMIIAIKEVATENAKDSVMMTINRNDHKERHSIKVCDILCSAEIYNFISLLFSRPH